MNLYGFVQNDGVNRWDFLGLEDECSEGDQKTWIHSVSISSYHRTGRDTGALIDLTEESVHALGELGKLVDALKLGKGAVQNLNKAAIDAIDSLRGQHTKGYDDLSDLARDASMTKLREIESIYKEKEGSWGFRGAMIIVRASCCECVCKGYLWWKSYEWDCEDTDKYIYVPHRRKGLIPHRDWEDETLNSRGPVDHYPKKASDITHGEIAEAIQRATEEANCDGKH